MHATTGVRCAYSLVNRAKNRLEKGRDLFGEYSRLERENMKSAFMAKSRVRSLPQAGVELAARRQCSYFEGHTVSTNSPNSTAELLKGALDK